MNAVRQQGGDVGSSQATESFATFYEASWATSVRLASLMGADDPEDVCQDAFLKLSSRFDALGLEGSEKYLRTVVCNMARSRWRRKSLSGRVLRKAGSDPTSWVAGALSVPKDMLSENEMLAAIAALSARQRQVIVLRYWSDLSEDEIAQVLKISTGSVKTHAHRGLAALQKRMHSE